MLVIKWEPRDVYLACALEDTRGHVQTTAVMFDHNVGVIRAIESLIRAKLLYNCLCIIRFFRFTLILFSFLSYSQFFFCYNLIISCLVLLFDYIFFCFMWFALHFYFSLFFLFWLVKKIFGWSSLIENWEARRVVCCIGGF